MKSGIERGTYLIAASLTSAAMFLSGCSVEIQESDPDPASPNQLGPHQTGKIACQAVARSTWLRPSVWVSVKAAAILLGVSEEQITNGEMGPAVCDRPIRPENIGIGKAVPITVDGIEDGDECLAIGLDSGNKPIQSDHAYTGILAICAASPPSFGQPA